MTRPRALAAATFSVLALLGGVLPAAAWEDETSDQTTTETQTYESEGATSEHPEEDSSSGIPEEHEEEPYKHDDGDDHGDDEGGTDHDDGDKPEGGEKYEHQIGRASCRERV